jgi:hypothetical protein
MREFSTDFVNTRPTNKKLIVWITVAHKFFVTMVTRSLLVIVDLCNYVILVS